MTTETPFAAAIRGLDESLNTARLLEKPQRELNNDLLPRISNAASLMVARGYSPDKLDADLAAFNKQTPRDPTRDIDLHRLAMRLAQAIRSHTNHA